MQKLVYRSHHLLKRNLFIFHVSKKKVNFKTRCYTLQAFHDRSLGNLPFDENKTRTAAQTLITACGGVPNDFSSVMLFLFNVFRASCAAISMGSALYKSCSHSFAFNETSSSMIRIFFSSEAAMLIRINKRVKNHVNDKEIFH